MKKMPVIAAMLLAAVTLAMAFDRVVVIEEAYWEG
jgi:hypothetical protein